MFSKLFIRLKSISVSYFQTISILVRSRILFSNRVKKVDPRNKLISTQQFLSQFLIFHLKRNLPNININILNQPLITDANHSKTIRIFEYPRPPSHVLIFQFVQLYKFEYRVAIGSSLLLSRVYRN